MNMDERFDRLEQLLQSTFDSLKSEMHQGFGDVKEGFDRLDARMGRMEARLDEIAVRSPGRCESVGIDGNIVLRMHKALLEMKSRGCEPDPRLLKELEALKSAFELLLMESTPKCDDT